VFIAERGRRGVVRHVFYLNWISNLCTHVIFGRKYKPLF
jgi:hypothetical protein